ncbi:MAG TPA: hypothetical protein VLE47_03340 [Candidatus Saccharimonadales bacterium]|nr:hypothetical protein [Candidatus Saccharimonadales bacterium]
MIYLLHGPDVVSSKNFLLKLKADYQLIETISEKNEGKRQQLLRVGSNLFNDKKLVVLENFPIKDLVLPEKLDYDLLLWYSSTVVPPTKADKVWFFKEKNSISSFKLADQIVYGQEKQALSTLGYLLETTKEEELIVGSLVRQLKLITLVLKGELSEVSQSSFLRDKTAEQAKNWSLGRIRQGALYLLKADLLMKTGRLSSKTVLANLTSDLCKLATSF